MFEEDNLKATHQGLGIEYDPEIFQALARAYAEPSRHYHNQSHVAELLKQFAPVRHLARSPQEIEIAIWFHDAVYDTRKSDNEEQSAEWARTHLTNAGAESSAIQRVVDMIIATKTHQSENKDALLLLDIDLGILGAPPPVFERYDEAIRKEYHWVPDETYRAGRLQVLAGFNERERIYRTDHFHDRLEAAARANLQRKIEALKNL